MDLQKLASDNLILKCVVGSHLYGTERAESDLDYYGVFIPTKPFVIGLQHCEQVMQSYNEPPRHKDGQRRKVEETIYSLEKAIHLWLNCNPNMISILYVPDHQRTRQTVWGRRLIEARNLFLSKRAYHTFRGYAHSQKSKMQNHERTGKRADAVAKYGFDPKFAMHLIRLLYECLDILTMGELIYPSRHNKLLLSIREGEKTLEWVFAEAERIEHLIDEAFVRSDLQHHPQRDKVEALQMEMHEEFWRTL